MSRTTMPRWQPLRHSEGIRRRWITAAIALAATLLCAVCARHLFDLEPHGGPAGIPLAFTPRVPLRALQYQRIARVMGLTGALWEIAGLWLFIRAGFALRLRAVVDRRPSRFSAGRKSAPHILPLAAYYTLFATAFWVWRLPFTTGYFYLEHKYGFGTQELWSCLRDSLVSACFGLLMIPLLWVGYRVYAGRPKRWWVYAWAGMIPVLYFIIVLQPVVVSPRFNSYTAMPPSALKSKIALLAARAGIRHADILIENTSIRSTHVNAYVTGLGPTARIVINDTSLRLLPEDEVLAMVGHETGHYVERHILIGYLCGCIGLGAFLYACSLLFPWILGKCPGKAGDGVTDLAFIPTIALVIAVFMLAQAPVENTISRYLEHRADAFGLRLTHLNQATARLMIGFAERDYVDPDPPPLLHFWFGTHPTLDERIYFALTYHPWTRAEEDETAAAACMYRLQPASEPLTVPLYMPDNGCHRAVIDVATSK